MHLRSFPHTYVKGDERRLAYYSVEARELREAGWVQDVTPKAEVAPEPVDAGLELITEQSPELEPELESELNPELEPEVKVEAVDFEAMTKRELLQYAMDRGVDLPDNALKADLIEACRAL